MTTKMRYASLGSGSKGNGTLVEASGKLLLIDCGFTIRETCRRIERLGCSIQQVSAVLVTHEHGDHLKGVGPLARKYSLPVYMTPGTYHSRNLGVLPHLHFIEGYQPLMFGELRVTPVAVPHDAREPAQFIFDYRDSRLGILTDLGSITPHVEQAYADCHALVLEANHDPHMLASGPYPLSLKQRVGGLWGHLSNQQAAAFLQRVDKDKLKQLVVAHISQQNNSLVRAQEAFGDVTGFIDNVIYACQEQGFDWLEVN